jgi:hypothetical protein
MALVVPRTQSPCPTSRTLAKDVVRWRALARRGTGGEQLLLHRTCATTDPETPNYG